jgi:hypothetical protein
MVDQNTWPDATCVSIPLFLVSVVAVERFGWRILPLFGILQFASISYFYYLLPIAFLPLETSIGAVGIADFLLPGVVWGASLGLGLLVSSTVNLLTFGHFGLALEPWRHAHPVTDFASLVTNTEQYASEFANDVARWLPAWSLVLLSGALIAFLCVRRYRLELLRVALMRTCYAGIIALSPFLTVLLAGIEINYRSLLPLGVGIISLPFLVAKPAAHPWLLFVTVVAIGIPSCRETHAGVE